MNMMMFRIKSLCALGLCLGGLNAQDAADPRATEAAEKAFQASTDMTWEANKQLSQNEFIPSEGTYRKAISKSGENMAAPFNLGNAYYKRESYGEAFGRYKQAGEAADEKPEKHKAFHNMGNVYMKRKEYQNAVEAYKEALRNDPMDDETRYNLALAKKMQEKQQQEQQDDQDKEQEDQKDQEQEKDQEQDQDQDKDQEKEGGDQEQKDQGDQGEDKPKEDQEGEGDNRQRPDQKPGEGDKPEEKQAQPRPNELSKQQIQNLLEAMQNEERKVQEKMDAKKVRGKKIRNEKDW